MTQTATKEQNHAEQQAKAQLSSVRTLVKAFEKAAKKGDTEAAEQAIQEDALSVEVRSPWQSVGEKFEATQYRIVLCTGGPHVEIQGDLNQYNEPDTAALYYQDWFEALKELPTNTASQDDLLTYARRFWFGE